MRVVPRRWSNETWICSIRGHVAPATLAGRLRPEDRALGIDAPDGARMARCLRCDLWLRTLPPTPDEVAYDVVPPLDELELPRRGKPLEDAILLRLIAIDRAVHGVMFTLLAIALFLLDTRLAGVQDRAREIAESLGGVVQQSGRAGGTSWLVRELDKLSSVTGDTIRVLLVAAIAYAVVESVEAVGLWKEKRWAEYLTVVATAGFLPLELRELADRVTLLRLVTLGVNLAILVWLVWSKRLFGLRGGASALAEHTDWDAILSGEPPPAE